MAHVSDDAGARVASNPAWYHTIEVQPGLLTPGLSDLRAWAPAVLPADLSGRRCLDIGTFDGFWAFEMERRGAREVIATDVASPADVQHTPHNRRRALDWQEQQGIEHGTGFAIAKDLLGSKAERVVCNVYDLSPETIGGTFEFAVVGALLQHLRDPIQALQNLRSVLVPGGEAVVMDNIDVALTLLRPRTPVAHLRAPLPDNMWTWWIPNLAGLRGWARTAGLEPISRRPVIRRDKRGLRGVFAAIRVRRPLD